MRVETDIAVLDAAWSRKRLKLPALSGEVLGVAWKHVKGKSRAQPFVSMTFTNDAEIKKINRKFRNKNKPTNVLSFQTWPDVASLPSGFVPVGDLVFAVETIEREAKLAGISFKDHLSHLMVHGFLHLFGFDHLDDDQAEIMEGQEIRILKKLGIKNPYAEHSISDKSIL